MVLDLMISAVGPFFRHHLSGNPATDFYDKDRP